MWTFDIFRATASDLHRAYEDGSLTIETAINTYLSQIEKCNGYLHAVISISPRELVIRHAKQLDKERMEGKSRGPLHGVPVIIKDNIATDPELGMETTAGTYALVGSRVKTVSPATKQLLDAGAIILAKANLSELSNFRGQHMPCGWSAVGGLTQNPYVVGGKRWDDGFGGHSSTGGSSSGSCAAVAAGFAPVALGTETNASIMMPATRHDVYSMKPTLGLISSRGVVPISLDFDTIGPIARSAADIAVLMDTLVDRSLSAFIPEGGYTSYLKRSFDGLRIGYLNPQEWHLSTSVASPNAADSEISAVYETLRNMGVEIKEVNVPSLSDLTVNGMSHIQRVMDSQFKRTINSYLQDLEISKVRTLEELMQFMKDNPELELPPESPNMKRLELAANSTISEDEYRDALKSMRDWGRRQAVDKCLKENEVDVIIGPADSRIHELSTAAGYPIATLPLSYLDMNCRPFGLAAVVSAYQEPVIIHFMSAWEENIKQERKLPTWTAGDPGTST